MEIEFLCDGNSLFVDLVNVSLSLPNPQFHIFDGLHECVILSFLLLPQDILLQVAHDRRKEALVAGDVVILLLLV